MREKKFKIGHCYYANGSDFIYRVKDFDVEVENQCGEKEVYDILAEVVSNDESYNGHEQLFGGEDFSELGFWTGNTWISPDNELHFTDDINLEKLLIDLRFANDNGFTDLQEKVVDELLDYIEGCTLNAEEMALIKEYCDDSELFSQLVGNIRDMDGEYLSAYIKANPEKFADKFSISHEDQIQATMNNLPVKDMFCEFLDAIDSDERNKWAKFDDDDLIVWESETTQKGYHDYVESSMDSDCNGFGYFEFEDCDVDAYWRGDILCVELSNKEHNYSETIRLEYNNAI